MGCVAELKSYLVRQIQVGSGLTVCVFIAEIVARGFPNLTHFWGVSLIVLNFRCDLVLIRERLSCEF